MARERLDFSSMSDEEKLEWVEKYAERRNERRENGRVRRLAMKELRKVYKADFERFVKEVQEKQK